MYEKLFKYLKNDTSKTPHLFAINADDENTNDVDASVDEVLDHFIKLIKNEFCDDDFLNAKNYKSSFKTDLTEFKKARPYSEKNSATNIQKLEKPDLVCR